MLEKFSPIVGENGKLLVVVLGKKRLAEKQPEKISLCLGKTFDKRGPTEIFKRKKRGIGKRILKKKRMEKAGPRVERNVNRHRETSQRGGKGVDCSADSP